MYEILYLLGYDLAEKNWAELGKIFFIRRKDIKDQRCTGKNREKKLRVKKETQK